LAERDALAADLRKKGEALNVAITAFNQAIEPASQAVREALEDYNEILEEARNLASSVTEAAQGEFDAKSEKWQDSDKGIQVRSWTEQREVSLDDVDLELPETLTEIDLDDQAGQIEGETGTGSAERRPLLCGRSQPPGNSITYQRRAGVGADCFGYGKVRRWNNQPFGGADGAKSRVSDPDRGTVGRVGKRRIVLL
jgi:hypothetical protein